jgi:hypothetical protein
LFAQIGHFLGDVLDRKFVAFDGSAVVNLSVFFTVILYKILNEHRNHDDFLRTRKMESLRANMASKREALVTGIHFWLAREDIRAEDFKQKRQQIVRDVNSSLAYHSCSPLCAIPESSVRFYLNDSACHLSPKDSPSSFTVTHMLPSLKDLLRQLSLHDSLG